MRSYITLIFTLEGGCLAIDMIFTDIIKVD